MILKSIEGGNLHELVKFLFWCGQNNFQLFHKFLVRCPVFEDLDIIIRIRPEFS